MNITEMEGPDLDEIEPGDVLEVVKDGKNKYRLEMIERHGKDEEYHVTQPLQGHRLKLF